MMIQSSTPDATLMKKPPRPWSADAPEYFYTIGSHMTHQYDMSITSNCLKGDTPTKYDRIRTTSVSAPPLNFKKQWNPLVDRHPGSAFDVVSSTSAASSRTCSPEPTTKRGDVCVGSEGILRPVPRRSSTRHSLQHHPKHVQIDAPVPAPGDEEDETLPDKLFRAHQTKLRESMLLLNESDLDDSHELTLPDKLYRAHMAKLGHHHHHQPQHPGQQPQIRGSSGGGTAPRTNGLKDRFVLNIIESFNEDSNVLKELSNMRITSTKRKKRGGLASLRKTWSSIVNLAVGVPPLEPRGQPQQSSQATTAATSATASHGRSERMYSLAGGYKSRSTACIAAL